MVPEAIAVMTEELARTGNASSLHGSGRAARRTVEEARELIAERLGARPSEIVFCSGGTEANNLAIKGLFWARREGDPRRDRIVFSAVEHHALLDPVTWLATHEGARVDTTPVDREGRIVVDALREAVESDPGQRRRGHHHVGEQRDGHRAAHRRRRRHRARARHPRPQ